MPPTESWETKRTKAETAKFNLESKKLRLETERLDLELESMNRHKGWIDTESGESSDTLIYSFDFPVQGSTVRETIHFLTRWSRRWPGEKMTIIFNSPGGEVTEGLALFDFIQELRTRGHEIETVSIGMAASMAGILLQAGDHRVMSKNAVILIHEISSITMGGASQMADDLKFVEMLQTKILSILAERSTLSVRQIKNRWSRKDWWLDADTALDLGFCDEIRY